MLFGPAHAPVRRRVHAPSGPQRLLLLPRMPAEPPPPPPERYGPLALVRVTKADGRALILFSHARA